MKSCLFQIIGWHGMGDHYLINDDILKKHSTVTLLNRVLITLC